MFATAVVAVALGGWAVPVGVLGVATRAEADTGSVTIAAAPEGADVSWTAQAGAYYYELSVQDMQTGSTFTAEVQHGFTTTHLSNLVAGDTYQVTVTGETGGTVAGSALVTPTADARSSLPAPAITSVTRQQLPGGAPALAVHVAAEPGARYVVASALAAQSTLAARTFAAASASGETVVLGPLQPSTTYNIPVAGVDPTGYGSVAWTQASTGAAGCSSACVTVGTPTTGAFSANGVLNAIPTSSSQFAAVRPAVFRVNTGYGSAPGAAQAIRATGADLIENLSDAWWDYSYSSFSGGAVPPWECWSCYSSFITSQVRTIESDGTSPAYWEVTNEPGRTSTYYPMHMQGDAALYLQQLQVAAKAIRSVDPTARILAPALGTFATDGTSLDKQNLTLDALLANAGTIPGLAGLDWHEIGVQSSPNIAASDVAAARMLASLAGLPQLAMVVSEYGTNSDAAIPGATAGWLSSLTNSGITYAGRSCFANQPVGTQDMTCTDELADGLFTTTGALTGPGLVSTHYADLAAGQLAPASSSDPGILALASISGGTARVLVGSAAPCLTAFSGTCPTASAPGATTVTVTVPLTQATSARLVTVTPSAGAGSESQPTSVPFTASQGVVNVRVTVPYGAAAFLTIG